MSEIKETKYILKQAIDNMGKMYYDASEVIQMGITS